MKRTTIIILLVALAVTPAWSANGRGKVARDLAEELDRGTPEARVIVTYAEGVSAADIEAIGSRGIGPNKKLNGNRSVAAKFSRSDIEDLALDSRVASISPDRPVFGSMDVAIEWEGSDVAPEEQRVLEPHGNDDTAVGPERRQVTGTEVVPAERDAVATRHPRAGAAVDPNEAAGAQLDDARPARPFAGELVGRGDRMVGERQRP